MQISSAYGMPFQAPASRLSTPAQGSRQPELKLWTRSAEVMLHPGVGADDPLDLSTQQASSLTFGRSSELQDTGPLPSDDECDVPLPAWLINSFDGGDSDLVNQIEQ